MEPPRPDVPPVPTVHLVAKTHLDVGFTALASSVVDSYVDGYIPAALRLAAELRERGGPERFVWTTGSWLVHTYLERADTAGRARAEEAIAAGDLAWHALPFTTHTELCDVALVEAGLEIAARLDHRFGRRTIAAKLTDVPGHTRGLVPLLASAGVELLHVGVNPVATVPDVPPAFRWRSPDGAEVVVVYQAGGYGDLTEVVGCPDRLAFAHTGDNLGPPGVDEVVASFAALRARLPGTEIRASTLDAFAAALRPAVATLPVVTAEVGDTWVHGVGSDPVKVARFRELLRLRRSWLDAGMVAPDDSRLRGFHEALLLVAEHTWGMDEKTHLPDRERWARADLPALRAEPRTRAFEASWAEQRAYVDAGGGGHRERRPAAGGDRDPGRAGVTRPAVGRGRRGRGRRAGAARPVGAGRRPDHRRRGPPGRPGDGAGAGRRRPPARAGGPPGLRRGGLRPLPRRLRPRRAGGRVVGGRGQRQARHRRGRGPVGLVGAGRRGGAGRGAVVVASGGPSDRPTARPSVDAPGRRRAAAPRRGTRSGAPAEVVVVLSDATPAEGPSTLVGRGAVGGQAGQPAARGDVGRVPAGRGRPDVDGARQAGPGRVAARRGGRRRPPPARGGRGRPVAGPDGTVALRTLDAPLVAPGRPSLLDPDPAPLDLAAGAWVCLHDNVWGTNFPMWSEGAARFRFELSVDPG